MSSGRTGKRLWQPLKLAVLARHGAFSLTEDTGEGFVGTEADFRGNLCDAHSGRQQESAGIAQTHIIQVLDKGLSGCFLYYFTNSGGADRKAADKSDSIKFSF